MAEQHPIIKNPLTVIAIFSGLAEVSGTGVLPFIAPENQYVYIWFLMLFPSLLVIAFFLSLNFNPGSLYAPSDYKNEENFFRNRFRMATPEEREEKLAGEISNVDVEESDSTTGPTQPNQVPERIDRLAKYYFSEKLALNRLSRELGLSFSEERAYEMPSGDSFLFDGVARIGNTIHVAEIKLINNLLMLNTKVIDAFLFRMESFSEYLSAHEHNLRIHLVLVSSNDSFDMIRQTVSKTISKYKVPVDLHIYTMPELLAQL